MGPYPGDGNRKFNTHACMRNGYHGTELGRQGAGSVISAVKKMVLVLERHTESSHFVKIMIDNYSHCRGEVKTANFAPDGYFIARE